MLKNSCFFIICRSYFSLPQVCIHCGNVFFIACEVTFIAEMYFFVTCEVTFIVKMYFFVAGRVHPSRKRYFWRIFALLPRNIHSRSNSSRVLSTLLSCCLPKL